MEPVSRHTTSPPASFIWQEKKPQRGAAASAATPRDIFRQLSQSTIQHGYTQGQALCGLCACLHVLVNVENLFWCVFIEDVGGQFLGRQF